ncbi:hypothetical protein KI387_031198, partial [Taxus chinensis]
MDAFHLNSSNTVTKLQQVMEYQYSLFITLLAAIVVAVIFLVRRPKLYQSSHKLPPGNLGLPLIGETFQFLAALRSDKPQRFFEERVSKFGDIFMTSLTGHPTIVVCGAKGNRLLLSNENKLVVVSWPKSFLKLMGQDSILAKTGEDHRILRAALDSLVAPAAIQGYISKISSEIEEHINEKWKGKDEVTVLPLVREVVFSLATTMFFDIKEEHEKRELYELLETIMVGSLSIPLNFPGTQFNRAVKARAKLDKILVSLVEKKRSDLKTREGASEKKDFITALLRLRDERGKGLTEKEIVDNLAGLIHASYDTTISPLVLMFKLLSSNPQCYEKMAQEQMEIFSNKKEGDAMTLQDVRNMKYTWQVVQETLRMFPPSFGTFRKAVTDIDYEGYTIPKGCKLLWTAYTTHHREDCFNEPEKFNPLRFNKP